VTFAIPPHIPEWLIHPDDVARLPSPTAPQCLTAAAIKRAQKEAEK
jgi:hypothetical protein